MRLLCKNIPQPNSTSLVLWNIGDSASVAHCKEYSHKKCKLEELGLLDTKYLICFARQQLKGPVFDKVGVTHQRRFPWHLQRTVFIQPLPTSYFSSSWSAMKDVYVHTTEIELRHNSFVKSPKSITHVASMPVIFVSAHGYKTCSDTTR
jgi:hypothetical protein